MKCKHSNLCASLICRIEYPSVEYCIKLNLMEYSTNREMVITKWAVTCDFLQCGILTCVDSNEPVQPPFMLRNSKWCSTQNIQATSKGPDQNARLRRLIWGFAGRTYHIVGNLMSWLNLWWYYLHTLIVDRINNYIQTHIQNYKFSGFVSYLRYVSKHNRSLQYDMKYTITNRYWRPLLNEPYSSIRYKLAWQARFKSVCAFVQSDQSLSFPPRGNVKPLATHCSHIKYSDQTAHRWAHMQTCTPRLTLTQTIIFAQTLATNVSRNSKC